MNTFLIGCMQWEAGAFSLLVGFGGCGVVVEGHRMNPDSDFGVVKGCIPWTVGHLEYRTCYIRGRV